MEIRYHKKKIILSHKPIILCPELNIHGHLHTKEETHRDYYKVNENNILVEAEKIYFIEELIEE